MEKEKNYYENVDYRFSAVLTLTDDESESKNDVIIFKRDFNIFNFDEKSLYSLNLKEAIDKLVTLIDMDLKSKSRVYTWYFFDENYEDEEFTQPLTKDNVITFKLTFFDREKPIISKIWSGDGYPMSVRNNVDLTNKRFVRNDNNPDFIKRVAGLASKGKPDITNIVMKTLASVCGPQYNRDLNRSEILKMYLPDVRVQGICPDGEGGFKHDSFKLPTGGLVADDNDDVFVVYDDYTTEISYGNRVYNLKV